MSALQHEIDRLRLQVSALQRERTGAETDELAAIQLRADAVLALHGLRARSATLAETPLQYRRALAGELAQYSPRYKSARIATYDEPAVATAEAVIYADAVEAARNGAAEKPGQLVAHHHYDESGRKITTWHGDSSVWLQHFQTGAAVGHIVDPRKS